MVLTFSINLLLYIFIHVYNQILVLLSYQIQHIQNISFITQMHVSMYRILERNGRNTIIDQPSEVRPDLLISPPRLSDIRSICVISASYYPFIGLWWAHMKFQSEIYGFWKIEKITFFQGSPLWKLFGTSKNANFQCIYKICCSFVILWDTDIPNMSN